MSPPSFEYLKIVHQCDVFVRIAAASAKFRRSLH